MPAQKSGFDVILFSDGNDGNDGNKTRAVLYYFSLPLPDVIHIDSYTLILILGNLINWQPWSE